MNEESFEIIEFSEQIKLFSNFEDSQMCKPNLSFKKKTDDTIYHLFVDDDCLLLLIPMYRYGKKIGYHNSSWIFPEAVDVISKFGKNLISKK